MILRLSVYNHEMILQGVCSVYSSLIWHRKFYTPGFFELCAPATPSNVELLKMHNFIEKPNSSEIGYIRTVCITWDNEKGEVLTISGNFLSSILSQRVALSGGTLREIVANNLITSSNNNRNLPNLILDEFTDIPCDVSTYGKNIGELIEALSRRDNFGYRITLDHTTKKMVFGIFQGFDRSVNQTQYPQVKFCKQYSNLLSVNYSKSDTNAVNCAYGRTVMPAGNQRKESYDPSFFPDSMPMIYSYANRYFESESDLGKTGFDRFETYIETEAKMVDTYIGTFAVEWNQQGTWTRTGDYYETSIDPQSFLDLNAELANAVLNPDGTENFEGKVKFKDDYKKDYDLGDVVTVFDKKWGISINQRITEVLEYYDHETDEIQPVFGSPLPTIMDILKNK